MQALINKVVMPSLVDGPGSRIVVFLQGCNMDCIYCHNPETKQVCNNCGICVPDCPTNALFLNKSSGKVEYYEKICINCNNCIKICPTNASPKVKILSTEELIRIVDANRDFIDGITFSGGECTLQSDFIIDFSKRIKEKYQTNILLDTNALLNEDLMKKLVVSIDGFMIDLKAYSDSENISITGKSNMTVIENIEIASKAGKLLELRLVLLEGLNDSIESINLYFEYLKKLNNYSILKLIPFRPDGVKGDYGKNLVYNKENYEKIFSIGEKILGKRIVKVKYY